MESTRTARTDRADLHLVDDVLSSPWGQPRAARTLRVLDADRELLAGLSPGDAAMAAKHVVSPVTELPVGEWTPRDTAAITGAIGVLVVSGVILRQVRVGTREAAELIGPGEVIRPLDADEGLDAPVPYTTSWSVVQEAELVVLDHRFAQVAARWPAILDTLFRRMTSRARSNTVLLAIAQLGGLELRVLALMWHLADRFGRVERDGVVIPVRLTHEMLARLAGAQRPSVTTALSRLKRQGLVRRRTGGCWVLHGAPPAELAGLPVAADAHSAGTPPPARDGAAYAAHRPSGAGLPDRRLRRYQRTAPKPPLTISAPAAP